MIFEILIKLASESLLSLYPIFVKNIGLSLSLQTWSRCFSYALIAWFFIDFSFVLNALFTYSGIMLSLVTILHIYASYRGFELLESGVAYSIFYLYPIMILLMSGHKIHSIMILPLVGVYLLASKNIDFLDIMNYSHTSISKNNENKGNSNSDEIVGVIMIGIAAFTEAIIYFLVRDIKTMNNWNHIFISYFLGAILLTWYLFGDIRRMKWNGRLSMSLGINSLIGLVGYLFRFYAVSKLDTIIYVPLSYFGIIMSFVYGVFINSELINLKKIVGAGLIIFSNLWLYFFV
jgi:uncharacterized membrane protein